MGGGSFVATFNYSQAGSQASGGKGFNGCLILLNCQPTGRGYANSTTGTIGLGGGG